MEQNENQIFDKQTTLVIDRAAISHNIKVIRKITDKQIIAVIKENGYGMGLKAEYDLLKKNGLDYFAVTNTAEALALRSFGCTETILLLTPCMSYEEAVKLNNANITFVVGSIIQANILKKVSEAGGSKPHVHIAIDTGMGRYGFFWNQIPDLSEINKYIQVDGCYTHLHGRPKKYKENVNTQLERFKTALKALKSQGINTGLRHVSNSQATVLLGDLGMDGVRVGSAIIGKTSYHQARRLKCAMWTEAPIYQTMELPKGSTVGYLATAKLKRDSRLGIVRAGHADGIFLSYSDIPDQFLSGVLHLISLKLRPKHHIRTFTINGKHVPIVGCAGVSHFTIDLTNTSFKVGDMVRIESNPLMAHPAVPRKFIN
ncbi:MAG: alanine racemase [Lachnospiraceae bacterium]|nr:alanine racemase [Lachnospiraceae bacterium]